jgi:hypothetical protein
LEFIITCGQLNFEVVDMLQVWYALGLFSYCLVYSLYKQWRGSDLDATQVRGKHSVKMGRDCFKTNHGVPLVPLVPLQFQALRRHFSHYNENIGENIREDIFGNISDF